MNDTFQQLSMSAHEAAANKDWPRLEAVANEMLRLKPDSVDGHYIAGTVHRVQRRTAQAITSLQTALELDPKRYDIAVELANMYSVSRRNGDAAELLSRYESKLHNSPRYLDLAGTIYTEVGLAEKAWPLFKRANELQPEVDVFKANLATCGVFIGKIDQARQIYLDLLDRFPDHRKNHYQLSRLKKADDLAHVEQMKAILNSSNEALERDIPLFFAIAKELEDLEQWQESFEYYRKACDSVTQVSDYDVQKDIDVIDTIIDICDEDWLADGNAAAEQDFAHTPIFIVGLPRTGTTLVERIVSSHSRVSSLGETLFLQMAIRNLSGIVGRERIDRDMLQAVASLDAGLIAQQYMQSVAYRLGDTPMFIEKMPLNFLYVGLIAKAWPQARIVHMKRNPLDACFSIYKQVFTWAYKFSYSLDDLGRYYVAYDRLRRHWKNLLKDRLIEVNYELLVSDQEQQTRNLLANLGLEFEQQCLHFEKNRAPSTTASSVQVRQRVHTGSVAKWKRFEAELEPLKNHLLNNGVDIG